MSQTDKGHGSNATAAEAKSKVRRRRWLALVGALVAVGAFPRVAEAHGAVDPSAVLALGGGCELQFGHVLPQPNSRRSPSVQGEPDDPAEMAAGKQRA